MCLQASGRAEGPSLRMEVRFCSRPYKEVTSSGSSETPSLRLAPVEAGVCVVVVSTFSQIKINNNHMESLEKTHFSQIKINNNHMESLEKHTYHNYFIDFMGRQSIS